MEEGGWREEEGQVQHVAGVCGTCQTLLCGHLCVLGLMMDAPTQSIYLTNAYQAPVLGAVVTHG